MPQYAIDFLKNKGIETVYYLSDYLGQTFFEQEVYFNSEKRENKVLYNPSKGFEFTQKLILNFILKIKKPTNQQIFN